MLLTMEFNEGEFLIKRAPSTRVGKIRQDCEDRVGWADKGSRHSDFIQMIIHWLGRQLHKSGNLKNRHFNSVWQHQGPSRLAPISIWLSGGGDSTEIGVAEVQ